MAYNYAAAAELIDDDVNGILASIDDPDSFINRAVELASNRARMTRVRTAAAPSVSHLHWASVGDVFATNLRAVIRANDRKRRAKNALLIATD